MSHPAAPRQLRLSLELDGAAYTLTLALPGIDSAPTAAVSAQMAGRVFFVEAPMAPANAAEPAGDEGDPAATIPTKEEAMALWRDVLAAGRSRGRHPGWIKQWAGAFALRRWGVEDSAQLSLAQWRELADVAASDDREALRV